MVASARMKWFALALLCVTQFVVVLDIAIVNVALPSIQEDLGFSQENLQWVISAYALVFGGFLLLGGRLADILGRRMRLHGRPRHLLGGLAPLRPRLERDVADRRSRAPGARRGDDHAVRALDPDHDVPRGPRAQHRARRLGRGRRLRRRRRRALRRHPHRLALLGVDLLRQRSRSASRPRSSRRSCSPRAGTRTARATTSRVRSSSRAASSSSSSGSRRATAGAGRSAKTIAAFVAVGCAARRLRALGAAADVTRSFPSPSSACRR